MKRIGVFGNIGIWICNFCRKIEEMGVFEKKENLCSKNLPETEEDFFLTKEFVFSQFFQEN